jgi:hypothetical protein
VIGYSVEGNQAIDERLAELDQEWDIERVLQVESSLMALLGLILGIKHHRRFLILPAFVASMVLLHGVQGWYPMLPVFRRLKLRTCDEINRERYALKAARGDFEGVVAASGGEAASREEVTERAQAAWLSTKS